MIDDKIYMRRRDILRGLGGVALAGLAPVACGRSGGPRVGIVGGGIIGAAVAMNLAEAGADVTLFEREGPAAGATGKSFAWLNAFSEIPHYRDIRLKAMAGYHQLERRLALDITWGGVLLLQREGAGDEEMFREAAAMHGSPYPLAPVNPDFIADMAPELNMGAITNAYHSPIDGHIDPVAVTRAFLSAAERQGARMVMPATVTGLDMRGDELRAVETSEGRFDLDRIVIAAGVDTPELSGSAGFRPAMRHSPGILAHSVPGRVFTDRVIYGPGLHFKQFPDGRIVGSDATFPPDTAAHAGIRRERMDYPDDDIRSMHGERIMGRIREALPGARDRALSRLTLGFRPLPEDGLPVVGYVPGSSSVYVAVMHSGVTLAPVIGQLVAREILEDFEAGDLRPYRTDRAGVAASP